MRDAKSLLDSMMGSVTALTKDGAIADLADKAKTTWNDQSTTTKGAIAGGLLGVLLSGNARRLVGSAAKVGGAALIGGLAMKAWEDWKSGKAADHTPVDLPEPQGTVFLPHDTDAADDLASRLLQAMVAAAKADGHITDAERARIDLGLEKLGLADDAQALIKAGLDAPLDIATVAALAHSPEESAEIYAASLLVVDPDGAAEKEYLASLAGRLGLDPDLVAQLHARVAALA